MSNKKKWKVEKPEAVKKTETFGVRISPRLAERVAKYASENELSLSEVTRIALLNLVESTPVASK